MAINPSHEVLWKALMALPKPVTTEAIETCAASVLHGKEASDFKAWFAQHSAYLIGRLNG